MQLLKVSENKRLLVHEDGNPFFWLGDTAWELFHRLNREEAEMYLRNRAEKGFNVVQAVVLAELDGLETGNSYGRRPLLKNDEGKYDPTRPDTDPSENNYSYWDHVDYIIDRAGELGIYVALLPTWGDKYNQTWGKGPEIFNGDNALVFGTWLGERYKDKKNIIWVLGGDRQLTEQNHYNVIGKMAQGIKERDQDKHLMTFHPAGNLSSSFHNHSEEWLDFNMIQSGHHSTNRDNFVMVTGDYLRKPVKPVLDAEPRYEDHPINFSAVNGYFDDYDARQAAYWAVFAGAFGHTYGHHSIWCMCSDPTDYFIMTWRAALNRPGAGQMQYLKKLIESRPFLERIPDQSVLADNYYGANYLIGTRGEDYLFIYSPNGLKIKVKMGAIKGSKVKAHWYDPRNGHTNYIGEFENNGIECFMPPSSGRNNDWVLILDNSEKNYPMPVV